MKLTLFLLFLFVFNHVQAQLLSNENLAQITKATNNHPLIALGEPEHFFKGFYAVKVQVVKHLIKSGQADMLILEAATASCRELDRYVKGDPVDAATILKDLNDGYRIKGAGLLNCSEILEMFQWIRKENITRKNKVSVAGMDFQQVALPVKHLRDAYKRDAAFMAMLDSIESRSDSLIHMALSNPVKLYTDERWQRAIKKHYATTQQVERYTHSNSRDKHLHDDATQLTQFAYIYTDINLNRDSIMAENVKKIVRPGEQAIIWAANFHTGKDSITTAAGRMLTLGTYLDKLYGEQYFKIAVLDNNTNNSNNRIVYPLTSATPGYQIHDLLIYCEKGDEATRLP